MRLSCLVACCAAAVLGCSPHPLVEDFARIRTYDIVQKIRCEARQQIRLLELDKALAPNEELHRHIIGFDFKLDITEKNNASGGILDFTNPVSGGKFTLALSGGAEKTRKSERFFRVFGTFYELREIPPGQCDFDPDNKNLIYPIAGNTGMAEVIGTYWELQNTTGAHLLPGSKQAGARAEDDDGSGKKEKEKDKGKEGGRGSKSAQAYSLIDDAEREAAAIAERMRAQEAESLAKYPSVFSDTLTFTTKLNAGIKPTLEVAAGTGRFRLTKASIDGSVERLDVHQVAVAIARRDIPARGPMNLSLYAATGRNPSLITSADTAAIILELDRLRNRGDDAVILESLRIEE